MAGRRKVPAALQSGHTWSKSQLEELDRLEQEMRGSDDVVDEIPSHLDEYGKIYYQYLIENLRSSKVPIANLDAPLITMVADALSKIYQCQLDINENGLVIESVDKNGNKTTKPNPHIKILHDYQNKFLTASSSLGLTPTARSSLAALQLENKTQEEDPILNIIKGLKSDD